MDEKTEGLLIRIIYWALAFVSVLMFVQNLDKPWPILILAGLLALSFTLRNALLNESPSGKNAGRLTLIFDLVVIVAISQLDRSGSSTLLFFIVAADASLTLPTRLSGVMTFVGCILQTGSAYYKNPTGYTWNLSNLALNALIFFIVFIAIQSIRYQIRQKQRLTETMTALKVKSRQLEGTYLRLKETNEDLEEMTIVKERNRIAREIHDTVGHTLTTVLLEMEAGERLIQKNQELASEKIKLAKEQVRKGLKDIRESLHTLGAGREMIPFKKSLELLIEDTTKSGEVFIHSTLGELPPLAATQEKMLYRALQEGLANGIRHGGSTAFVFSLKEENGYIRFSLSDNGEGTGKIEQGFGLIAMEERVLQLGGTLNFITKKGEGFTIQIVIPIAKEVGRE